MAHVRDALRADGAVVWTDEHIEIADRDAWQKSIDLALNDSKSLVVLISEASITDSDIQAQAQTAQSLGLPIFPVLIKDVPSDIPPLSYTAEPYIDARGDNFFLAIEKLRERLRATIFVLPPGQQFSRFNPLNWFRLIWWTFFNLSSVIEHKKYYGRNHMSAIMASGVGTLLWFPFVVILTGTIRDGSLNNKPLLPISPIILLVIVIVIWLVMVFWGYKPVDNKFYRGTLEFTTGFFVAMQAFGTNFGGAGGIPSILTLNIALLIIGLLGSTLLCRVGFTITLATVRVLFATFMGTAAFAIVAGSGAEELIVILTAGLVTFISSFIWFRLVGLLAKILLGRKLLFNLPLFLALILSNAYIIWVYWLGGAQVLGYIS